MQAASPPGQDPIPSAEKPLVRVVDDDEAIQSLFEAMAANGRFAVAGFRSVQAFLERPRDDRPGCLVLDLVLPDGTGIDVLAELAARGDELPVVFMSGRARVSEAVAALKLGSLDFVEKPFDRSVMLDAIQRAIACDRELRGTARDLALVRQNFARLTPRESEVMDLIVEGCSNKEVAARLHLSPKTIEVHRANVMRKTEAQSLAELVRMHLAMTTSTPVPLAGRAHA